MGDTTFSMNLWRIKIDMTPEFTEGGGQLEYVAVVIYKDDIIISSFMLKDEPEPVTAQESDGVPGVDGKMYLDYYKQKIIFEGHYIDTETPNILGNFWLEIVPDYMFFNNKQSIFLIKQSIFPIINDCSKHPVSIGSLCFAMDPVKAYSAATAQNNLQKAYKVSVFQLVEIQTKETKFRKVPHLSAILSPNMKLHGIDTAIGKHDVDFKGDVGFLETGARMFIDGDIIVNNIACCSFYIEFHQGNPV